MGKSITITVYHNKNERIELCYQNKNYKLKFDKYRLCSIVTVNSENLSDKICIKQSHPINSLFWWKYFMIPITFLQGYFLRYERQYIDDYYAQIEFCINSDSNCDIILNLNKNNLGVFVDKSFYINIRKDKYLINKVEAYNFSFYIKKVTNCIIKDIFYNKDVSKAFIFKWRLVRIIPAIFSYGALAFFPQYYFYEYIKKGIFSIDIIILLSILIVTYHMIFIIFKKVINFNTRKNGIPWRNY